MPPINGYHVVRVYGPRVLAPWASVGRRKCVGSFPDDLRNGTMDNYQAVPLSVQVDFFVLPVGCAVSIRIFASRVTQEWSLEHVIVGVLPYLNCAVIFVGVWRIMERVRVSPATARRLVPLFWCYAIVDPIRISEVFRVAGFIFPHRIRFRASVRRVASVDAEDAVYPDRVS